MKKRPKDLQLQGTSGNPTDRKTTAGVTAGGSSKQCPNAEWSQSGSYVVGDLRIKDCGVKREVASPSTEGGTAGPKSTPDVEQSSSSSASASASTTTDAVSGIHPDDLHDEKVLGRGASGTVMLVRHQRSGVQYAVKVINIGAGSGGGVDTRMVLQEINTIDHTCPFLVRAFTAFIRDKHLHIVQEYMDKGSLADVLKSYQKGGVPEGVLAIIAAQLLQGLAHLHSGGGSSQTTPVSASGGGGGGGTGAPAPKKSKLHRDLKPANILACSQGMVKISDFGIATTVNSTGNSTMVGTTTYMSPERIRGERYHVQSDIWSAGLVLCELCLGYYPFRNCATFFSLLKEITKPQQFQFPEGITPQCKDFIMSCMKQKPEERPTAQALLQHPFVMGANVSVEEPSQTLAEWLASITVTNASEEQQQQPGATAAAPAAKGILQSCLHPMIVQ